MICIGIDTSCYTTSVAAVDVDSKRILFDKRIVLNVKSGNCGLRQSDGVFLHTKNLPTLIEELFRTIDGSDIGVVCVSEKPTPTENSYMPVFLAGVLAATSISSARSVPLIARTHQEGHIRAALVGNEQLMNKGFLAYHISGGTTDLLNVSDNGIITEIGTSSDLHLGQLFDRIGVAAGLPFPCGAHAELMAAEYLGDDFEKIPTSVKGMTCSLSGAENRCRKMLNDGKSIGEVFYALYDFSARTLARLLNCAVDTTDVHEVILSGGVSSSTILRKMLTERLARTRRNGIRLYFGAPELSRDNAVGVALLGADSAVDGKKIRC